MKRFYIFVLMAFMFLPLIHAATYNTINKPYPSLTKAWVGAAIGAGASLIGGLIGSTSSNKNVKRQIAAQKEENAKNRAYNLMLAQKQNAWNQEQWERENEYNSPVNQMKRYQEAGLNPDLMYQNGNSGNAMQLSGGMTSGAPSSPMDYSVLGQKKTIGDVIKDTLSNEMMRAQIDKVKAETRSEGYQGDILKSDAAFRDAINQGNIDLGNIQIEGISSNIQLNDANIKKFRYECSKLEAETKNVIAEYDKIRSSIANLDADTASKRLHDALDSKKVTAEIKKLSASAGLDFANTKRIITLLSAELAGIQAHTAESWANVSIRGAEQVSIEATTEGIRYDLSQAKSWSDIERGTGVYGKIMQGLTPIANLIGIAIGSGALRGKPNPIGFRR